MTNVVHSSVLHQLKFLNMLFYVIEITKFKVSRLTEFLVQWISRLTDFANVLYPTSLFFTEYKFSVHETQEIDTLAQPFNLNIFIEMFLKFNFT
jgi:hypothetical protein